MVTIRRLKNVTSVLNRHTDQNTGWPKKNSGSNPGRGKKIFFLHSFGTGSGTQEFSYKMSIEIP
jgi:hypothetical protein